MFQTLKYSKIAKYSFATFHSCLLYVSQYRLELNYWRPHSPEEPGDIGVEEAERRSGMIIQYRRVNVLVVVVREVLSVVRQLVPLSVLLP